MTRTTFLKIIRFSILGLVILIILGYSLWRSFDYLEGPQIEIFEPKNFATISTPTVKVVGKSQNITKILLNGHPLSMNEEGDFTQSIVVFEGINYITIEASDQFERSVKRQMQLWGEEPN